MHQALRRSQDTVNRVKRGQRLQKVLQTPYFPPSISSTLSRTASPSPFPTNHRTHNASATKTTANTNTTSPTTKNDGFDSLHSWRGHVSSFRQRFHAARHEQANSHRRQLHVTSSSTALDSARRDSSTIDTALQPQHVSPETTTAAISSPPSPISLAERLTHANLSNQQNATEIFGRDTAPTIKHQSSHHQSSHHHPNHPKYTSSLEYAAGTGLLYGSRVCFECNQKKFLHVDVLLSTCTVISPPENDINFLEANVPPVVATRLQLLNAADPTDRSPVRYGDTVWLGVDPNYRHDHGTNYGGHFVGTKLVATGDIRGGGSSSSMAPCVQRKKTVRGMEVARWVVVALEGYVGHTKGKPVGHMDEMRLELEWVCLGAKTAPNGQDVNVIMMPAGGMAEQAQKTRKMSETVERWHLGGKEQQTSTPHGTSTAATTVAAANDSNRSVSNKRRKKTKKVSLTAGWGTAWKVYLSELANDSGNGGGNGGGNGSDNGSDNDNDNNTGRKKKRQQKSVSDRGDKLLLQAQNRLMESRSKRRERGDSKWVREIEYQRAQTEKDSEEMCALATSERNGGSSNNLSHDREGLRKRGVVTEQENNNDQDENADGMGSFLRARYAIASTEGFDLKKRGAFWEHVEGKERERKKYEMLNGGGDGTEDANVERGAAYYLGMWEEQKLKKNKKNQQQHHHQQQQKQKQRQQQQPAQNHFVDQGQCGLEGTDGGENTQWPDSGLNRVEKARALAKAAALEAKIKSSVWQVVGRHRTFLQAQEEHRLLIAVTALQRAVRAWIRTRWQRRFKAQDTDIVEQLVNEEEDERNKRKAMESRHPLDLTLQHRRNAGNAYKSAMPWKKTLKGQLPPRKSKKPTVRLVPSKKLRWSMASVRERAKERRHADKKRRERSLRINKDKADKIVQQMVCKNEPIIDPRLANALSQTPEGSNADLVESPMMTTSLPLKQPPPEMLNLGTSLWAGSLSGGHPTPASFADRYESNSGNYDDYVLGGLMSTREEVLGGLRKSKSDHLRRLRLLPPSVDMSMGLIIGHPENNMNRANRIETSDMDNENDGHEAFYQQSLVGNLLSSTSAASSAASFSGRGGEHSTGGGVGQAGRANKNTTGSRRTAAGRTGNVRSRPSSALVTRKSRQNKNNRIHRGRRPASANRSKSMGRTQQAVRDTAMMLSGLSLGYADRLLGAQKSQSSFAARLQQSIVRGRMSQSTPTFDL